jgi:hypothetical protein
LLAACAGRPPTIIEENVLFRDEFAAGQTGSWVLEADEAGRTAIVNEQLLIEINAPHTLQFATLAEPTFADFVVEVEARQLAGDSESSFGLLLRMQNGVEFYRFEITGSGLYIIERRHSDGAWTRLIEDWTESSLINQGLNAPNRLRVAAMGPLLSFYVNDLLLQEVTDATYAAGTIGLDAGTFNQANLQVAFDNLVVRRP